ncbi:MAG: cell division protein ZipA [Natronospirillum sp.]|uniref:cell division protein ZipA n=1 Tax=Natronospirillum sp. TaxID=2812955 RepID=UPI0025FD0152|nr:cell division protein ZipA [Natronospirillum sp.]MCH8551383.1 cell division protein ZipA [Natronospirillum sp.]
MGLREWVIVLAIIFMVVLALDAWRRVRRQQRYQGSYTRPRSSMTAGQTRRHPDSRPTVKNPDLDEPDMGPDADLSEDSAVLKVSRIDAVPEPEPVFDEPEAQSAAELEPEPELDPVSSLAEDTRMAEAEDFAAEWPEIGEPEEQPPVQKPAAAGPPPEPDTRPGEKVPMLVDSVETPDDEWSEEAEAAEDQYEFDLQAAREAAEQDRDMPAWRNPLVFGKARSSTPAEPPERTGADEAGSEQTSDEPVDSMPDPFAEARERLAADEEDSFSATRDEPAAAPRRYSDPDASPFADLYDELEEESTAWETDSYNEKPVRPTSVEEDDTWDEPDEVVDPVLEEAEQRRMDDDEASGQLLAEPEEVLVITVLAQPDDEFDGTSLLQIMLACGMRFGRMNIFHSTDDEGRLQFSAANAFNPGTFDLDNVEHFATRGVTFFLQLPSQSDPMEAFDAMYQTATVLATNLHGDIHDDNRSVMTAQTLTHYRERIRDFQRSQLVRRA